MKKYIALVAPLAVLIVGCNSGSSNGPSPLYLNAGTYKLSYSFESFADRALCVLAGYNTEDTLLGSDGNGNLCAKNNESSCFNNVNYVYNPCYSSYVETLESGGGYIFDSTQWQNCSFESTGGTAKLNYVTGIRVSLVIFPLGGCGADISIVAESN